MLPYDPRFLGILVHQVVPHRLVPQDDVKDCVAWSHSTDELVFQLKVRKAYIEQIYLPEAHQMLGIPHRATVIIP